MLRRKANRTFIQGRRGASAFAQAAVKDGRQLVAQGLHEGRRALQDSRRALESRFKDSRLALSHGLGDGRRLLRQASPPKTSGLSAPMLSGLLVAAGAGVTLWWWMGRSRRRAEAQARKHQEGGGEVMIDHAELVMAHNVEPPEAPLEVYDKADEKLVEPAQELMAHAPVDLDPPRPAGKPHAGKPVKAEPKRARGDGAAMAD